MTIKKLQKMSKIFSENSQFTLTVSILTKIKLLTLKI